MSRNGTKKSPVSFNKRGFSLAIGLGTGVILLLMVLSLVFYSSQEMKIVSTMLGMKKSDFAAYSGINVVDAKLCEKRWYQPVNNPNVAQKFKSSHVEKLEAFFKDETLVDTKIFIDEIPHPKALKNSDKSTEGSIWVTTSPGKRQYRSLLDHIRVLALGTAGDEKSLYFGKFIMVPEPYLADDQSVGHFQEGPLAGEDRIAIYPEAVWDNVGEEGLTDKNRKSVERVFIRAGDKVKMGQKIMVLGFYISAASGGGTTTRREEVVSPYSGTVKEVLVVQGQDTLIGQPVAYLEKDPGDLYAKKTLRKMVQITKIPLSVFKDLNLESRKDRFQVYNYISQITLESVVNRVPMQQIRNDTVESFKGVKTQKSLKFDQAVALLNSSGKPQWGVDDIEKMFEALNAKCNKNLEPDIDVNTDYDRIYSQAGKSIISSLWSGFTPPVRLASSTSKKFPQMAEYKLGVQPSKVSDEMLSLIKLVSIQHGIDYISQLETDPQKDPGMYNIASTTNKDTEKGYWEYMANKENLGNKSGNVKDYIERMSKLKNGAKKAVIKLDQGTPWEDDVLKDMVANGEVKQEDYFWWEEKQGWYKNIPKENVRIESYDIPYAYKNNTDENDPFQMENANLLEYFRKHYTFGTTQPPADDYWAENTITDTPQRPGPPDSTGAKYSGLSS